MKVQPHCQMLHLYTYKVCAFKGITVRNFKFNGVSSRLHLEWRQHDFMKMADVQPKNQRGEF